jgi:hypothetical protein
MIIYGWTEQNICAGGINKQEIDLSFTEIEEWEDGSIRAKDSGLSYEIPSGQWFSSFSKAKKACLQYWTQQLSDAKTMLGAIRSTTKKRLD